MRRSGVCWNRNGASYNALKRGKWLKYSGCKHLWVQHCSQGRPSARDLLGSIYFYSTAKENAFGIFLQDHVIKFDKRLQKELTDTRTSFPIFAFAYGFPEGKGKFNKFC